MAQERNDPPPRDPPSMGALPVVPAWQRLAQALVATVVPTPVAQWFARRLRRRLVTVFLGLLLVVQSLSFLAADATIDRNALDDIARDLGLGENVLRRLLAQNAQKLHDGARLLAADYGFRSAVSSNDHETIVSALVNHGDRIGASATLLLDTGFAVRASAHAGGEALLPAVQRMVQQGRLEDGPASRPAGDVAELGGKPVQLVMVPVRAPLVVGWVVMGFPLDHGLADDLHAVSGLHMALRTRSDPQAPWQIQDSTLASTVAWPPGIAASGVQMLTLDGQDFGAQTVSLGRRDDRGAIQAVLLKSFDEALDPYRRLQFGLALVTVVGLAVFAAGSVVTARRVTTPIRELVRAADRLGRGDYGTPLNVSSPDEIGDLAQAFERMRASIDTQKRQIVQLAYHDPLTDLPNRARFRASATEAIEQARERSPTDEVSVLMLDLDRFKHVNDVLGLGVGDRLLQQVAQRLSHQVGQPGELVARLGGDEFAVLLPGTGVLAAQAVAQRVVASFEQPLMLDEHAVDLGAGIGIATYPLHAQDADALVSRAEVAMYVAKRRTAGVTIYDSATDSGSVQTLSLLGELRHAIERGELRLYLQPKVGLADARVLGAEALVRWQHPQRGLVPPMQFIPFAEQTGFIRMLTAWIVGESLRVWQGLRATGQDLRLSVNLSTRDLMDPDLPAKFEDLLARQTLPAEALCLEITESAIMDDPARAQQTLERLSEMGFHLAIDDFGTGYSSLAYLKSLPVDELKIDKSFVMQMTRDSDDAKIVRSTIDLAHNLGLSVVAEGVETASVWRALRSLECDQAQGHLIGRPMPAGEFKGWTAAWEGYDGLALRDTPNTVH